ncbi:MAG: hypothetical protein JSW04_08630 [Desulfobacterales bacterium]|nr:MAG: hypothetical protein JSW04_08630 [Desulfobacterales bacterium]
MAKSGKQRQKEFRERRKNRRQINVYFNQESSERLDRLKDELNVSIAGVLQRTMEFYENSHSTHGGDRIFHEDETETVDVNYRVTFEDEPKDIYANISIKNEDMVTRKDDGKKRKKLRSKKKIKLKNIGTLWG